MSSFNLIRNKFNIFLLPIYILIIITIALNSGSALITTDYFVIIKYLLYSLIFIMIFEIIRKNGLNIRFDISLIFYLLLMSAFLLSIVYNISLETIVSSLRVMIIITFAFLLTRLISFYKFVNIYLLVMKYLTVISLISWLVILIFGVEWLPSIENRNGVTYYSGIFFFFINSPESIIRNMSIFWEPGIFASFLIIALIFESCFKNRSESKMNLIIFILGVLSTQSSAGFILLLIYLCIRASLGNSQKNFIAIIIFTMIIMLISINFNTIAQWLVTLNYELFHKLLTDESDTTGTRLYSPIINLSIFKESPIFGMGFYEADFLYAYLIDLTYSTFYIVAQTSTSTFYLASLGILGTIYTFGWILGILKINFLSITTKVLLVIVFLSIINKEPHMNILVTYCIFFYFLKIKNPVAVKR